MATDDATTNSKTAEKFVVRLPRGMRRRIAEAARVYRRSMNSEIVSRLERSLNEPSPEPAEASPLEEPDCVVAIESLTELELSLIRMFRSLPAERQRALIQLLT